MTTDRYPLLDERTLPPAGRRRFRPWRDPATLPEVPPGAVLVLRTAERYEVIDGQHLRGTEDTLIDATAVSVVDRRARQVPADLHLTSAGQAIDFLVRVTFSTEVVDAGEVVRQGLTHLGAVLADALRQDADLVKFNDRFAVDDIRAARAAISAHVMSAYQQRPPRVDGMRIRFSSVHVLTPAELREQAIHLQDSGWAEALEALERDRERERLRHNAELMRSPETMRIAAVARGEITMADAAQDAFSRRETQIAQLMEQVRAFTETGEADRDVVDRRHIQYTLDTLLTGSPTPRAEPAARADRPQLGDIGTDDDLPDYIPMEDDDDDR